MEGTTTSTKKGIMTDLKKTVQELNELVLACAAQFPATVTINEIDRDYGFPESDVMRLVETDLGFWDSMHPGPVGVEQLVITPGNIKIVISGYDGTYDQEHDSMTEMCSTVTATINIDVV